MHIEWNKVTWYSKLLAAILFIVVLYVGFVLGMQYQSVLDTASTPILQGITGSQSISSTTSLLSTTSQNIVVTPQPSHSTVATSSGYIHCGGFIQNAPTCPEGSHCQLNSHIPDTGGICVPN